MTERERLVKLIKNAQFKHLNLMWCEAIMLADELLENGVIVPPCKVGNKVYNYDNGGRIYESEVVWFYYDKDYKRVVYDCDSELAFSEEAIGKSVFLTREEAEKALKEYEDNA